MTETRSSGDAEGLRVETRSYADPVVARLVAEVQAEYVLRYGSPDQARIDPAEFDPPAGLFLVAFLNGEPVATGGWRRLPPGAEPVDPTGAGRPSAELKRMFVVASARRRGIAQILLAQVEATAAAAGVRRLVLNTGTEQPEAVALYETNGYVTSPGFGHYADAPRSLFYAKDLDGP